MKYMQLSTFHISQKNLVILLPLKKKDHHLYLLISVHQYFSPRGITKKTQK